MTPGGASARRGRNGFALVAVLGGLLVLGAVAFALLFTASLDSLAVRARHGAVVAREELEGALALAVAQVWQQHEGAVAGGGATADPTALPQTLGPWPQLGFSAQVSVEALPTQDQTIVIRLGAALPDGNGRQTQWLTLQVQPEWRVLRR